jgi:pilus assembly protein Flp/PilA
MNTHRRGTGTGDEMRKLWSDESGQDLVEYALLAALLSLAAVAAMMTMGDKISALFGSLDTAIVVPE